MSVVDSQYSCLTDFVCSPCVFLFCVWRMLVTDEVLENPLLLEVSDPPSSGSFLPIPCPCWSFLSSLVFSSRDS